MSTIYDRYVPATFEERGVAVPFTTPALSQARLRRDFRNRLELVIPSLAEARGIYVLPMSEAHNVLTMTVHDRCLQDELLASQAVTPHQIASVVRALSLSGTAGPEVVSATEDAIAAEGRFKAQIFIMLLTLMVRSPGEQDLAAYLSEAAVNPEKKKLARERLEREAEKLRITTAQLEGQIQDLANIVAAVGFGGSKGRLMRGLDDLRWFIESLNDWGRRSVSDTSGLARFCASVAALTCTKADEVTSRIEKSIEDIPALLADPRRMDVLKEAVIRLAWLLDGWDSVIEWWRAALANDMAMQERELTRIFSVVPMLPKECIEESQQIENPSTMGMGKSFVRAHEDWRTGRIDYGLVSRLEATKARTERAAARPASTRSLAAA